MSNILRVSAQKTKRVFHRCSASMPARILIADDNPIVRATLRNLLEALGPWDITEAQNGQEAVSLALELCPTVIILDLSMPVMDGLTAAREISKVLPGAAVIMSTMHWTPYLELEAQKCGVRRIVSKSQGRILLATVQQL